ncbi:MAG: hydrogen gas-evolving membrane-bound hydrogenase subunit E [Candidatus Omnitrophota bacterium]|jgi:multisubunit Na+/H+ antiporter MnhB subunit
MLEIHLILLFMIAAAIIAVEVRDMLSSVVAVGAVGIGLSLAFLVLKAPDLAIMQLVVEILSLIILVRATSHRDLPFSASGRWVFNTVSTISFILIFLACAYISLLNLPVFGAPQLRELSKFYIDEARTLTATENIVESIALRFRAYDSLGEATAIVVATIGVLAIARRVSIKGKADDER